MRFMNELVLLCSYYFKGYEYVYAYVYFPLGV